MESDKREEERLMRRMRGSDPSAPSSGPKKIVVEAPKVSIRNPSGKEGRVVVELVTQANHASVLRSLEVTLNQGRIPMQLLINKWNLRKPVWVDADLPVGMMLDGYSELEFVGMDKVRIADAANN